MPGSEEIWVLIAWPNFFVETSFMLQTLGLLRTKWLLSLITLGVTVFAIANFKFKKKCKFDLFVCCLFVARQQVVVEKSLKCSPTRDTLYYNIFQSHYAGYYGF